MYKYSLSRTAAPWCAPFTHTPLIHGRAPDKRGLKDNSKIILARLYEVKGSLCDTPDVLARAHEQNVQFLSLD